MWDQSRRGAGIPPDVRPARGQAAFQAGTVAVNGTGPHLEELPLGAGVGDGGSGRQTTQ